MFSLERKSFFILLFENIKEATFFLCCRFYCKKINFIIDKAEVSDEIYSEYFDGPDNENLLDNDFIVPDQTFENYSGTFYRKFDNLPKFLNQPKNADLELGKDHDIYFGEDGQPEMFTPESIDHVKFHDFSNYKKRAEHFKKTLLCFPPETEQIFFFVCGLCAFIFAKE